MYARKSALVIERGRKICGFCDEDKPLEAFYPQALGLGGRTARCIECHRKYFEDAYADPIHREVLKARSRQWYSRMAPDDKREMMAAISARRKREPTSHLGKGLRRLLQHRPTDNPITVSELGEMWRAQGGRCAVSGVVMTWANGKHTPTSISIDRINPAIGYTRDNVRLVCYQVNLFKSEWTDDDMYQMALAIVTNAKKPKLRIVS